MSIWGTQSGNSISIPCYQETPVEDNGRGMRDHLRVCPPDGSNMEERKGVPWCCAALIAGRTRNPLKNRWRLALGTPLGIFQKYSPKIPRTFQLGWVRILPPIFPPQDLQILSGVRGVARRREEIGQYLKGAGCSWHNQVDAGQRERNLGQAEGGQGLVQRRLRSLGTRRFQCL